MSKYTLNDIVDFNPKRTLKKGTIAPFVEMAALPINARDITNIDTKEFTGSGSKFKNGDTLFARITPCLENGKTAKVSGLPENEIAHGSTEFIVLSAKLPEYDEDYIYYLSRLPEFRQYAQARMEGTSGRQRVSWQSLSEFEYSFPEKETRKKAAQFLKKLDDKIRLNTQTNQTLEHIAQALFKSWFIDFDPVKAKAAVLAEGGSPHAAERAAMRAISGKNDAELDEMQQTQAEAYRQLAATAALFPCEMEDSELGGIPKGWEVSTIGESYVVTMGQSPKGETYNENQKGMLFYQGRAEFGWRFPSPRLFTTDPKRIAKKDDILMSVRAPVGDLNIATEECCIGRGLAALRHKSHCMSFGFYQMQSLQEKLNGFNAEGTVFGSINQKELKNFKVVLPSVSIIQIHHELCGKIDLTIRQNSQEILTLQLTRDTLLPQLLSGSLPLPDEAV